MHGNKQKHVKIKLLKGELFYLRASSRMKSKGIFKYKRDTLEEVLETELRALSTHCTTELHPTPKRDTYIIKHVCHTKVCCNRNG